MARITEAEGASSADVTKELTLLKQQGKVDVVTNKLLSWEGKE
jgi:hypothetical protein